MRHTPFMILMLCISVCAPSTHAAPIQIWASTTDAEHALAPQPVPETVAATYDPTAVVLDPASTFQSILGLGSSLEHATCYNISLLPEDKQDEVIKRLFDPDEGIGINLMRVAMGTSDFTPDDWYTYDDVPEGETDPELAQFSIEKDRRYVLPILKKALKANPDLQFFASPWSPPGWMKKGGIITGGRINPDHFAAYAQYFAKFLRAYEAEGIPIIAVTIQNEPGYFPNTYPTCGWRPSEQRDFIRDHLGPLFKQEGISTKIWCFDHNFNNTRFPATILEDAEAAAYVDGSAFHHYEGEPEEMQELQARFPDKHLYFTEGSTYGVGGAIEIMRILRSGARSYNAWVTMIDHNRQPNRGPHQCSPTSVVLNSETLEVDYRFDYYMYGHFMKFIPRGSARIDSGPIEKEFGHVAFRTPEGSIVAVLANNIPHPRPCALVLGEKAIPLEVAPKSIYTVVWPSES